MSDAAAVPSPYGAVGPKPRQAPFWGALISLRKLRVSCLSCVLFHLPWAANLTPSIPLFLSLLSLLSSPSLLREEPPGCNGPLRRARFAACKSFINGRYLYHNWEKTTSLSEGTWKRGERAVWGKHVKCRLAVGGCKPTSQGFHSRTLPNLGLCQAYHTFVFLIASLCIDPGPPAPHNARAG